MNNEHLKIQKLNDSFRTSLSGGKVMITRGIFRRLKNSLIIYWKK